MDKKEKVYNEERCCDMVILPGDPQGLPDDFFKVVVFVDNAYLMRVKRCLWTYFERKRNSPFSRCNELIKAVDVCVKLTRDDFEAVEK